MKQAILFFTDQGLQTALNIVDNWPGETLPKLWVHHKAESLLAELCATARDLGKPEGEEAVKERAGLEIFKDGKTEDGFQAQVVNRSKLSNLEYEGFTALKEILPAIWRECSVLIFIMSSGIVVRHIAPYLQSKDRDPAILVLDEKGEFVIPLLSGHLGGANAWARELAKRLKAQAVLTTATDVRGLTAPDEYARRFGWAVDPLAALHSVNRYLLDQGYLLIWDELGLPEQHPLRRDPNYRFVSEEEKGQAHVWLGLQGPGVLRDQETQRPVQLIPRVHSVGVGCRRGVAASQVLAAIQDGMAKIGMPLKSIQGIYSIDLKADEMGIQEAAHELRVPFQTFTAGQVQALNEDKELSQSNFVRTMIGVDGVCEAASLLGTIQGELILPKQKMNGVTVAVSREKSMSWESVPETLYT